MENNKILRQWQNNTGTVTTVYEFAGWPAGNPYSVLVACFRPNSHSTNTALQVFSISASQGHQKGTLGPSFAVLAQVLRGHQTSWLLSLGVLAGAAQQM